MQIKIGSFNCLNFGIKSLNTDKSEKIAKIIKDNRFDIVALQEIKGQRFVNNVLNKLNCGSKGVWRGCADCDFAVNDYAFIWNSRHVDLPRTKLQDGSIRVFYPHVYKQYSRDPELGKISLARPPFYGRFQTIFPGLPKYEIRLINTHIRYSKGKDGEELAPTSGEQILRKYEFKALATNIYYKVTDKVYGKRDGENSPMTAYTILLGDYNLNLKESNAGSPYLAELETITINCQKEDKKIVTKQSQLTTLKKKTEQNDDGKIFSSNYDHFSYDANRFDESKCEIDIVDTVKNECKNDAQEHLKTISDHIPIKMILTI